MSANVSSLPSITGAYNQNVQIVLSEHQSELKAVSSQVKQALTNKPAAMVNILQARGWKKNILKTQKNTHYVFIHAQTNESLLTSLIEQQLSQHPGTPLLKSRAEQDPVTKDDLTTFTQFKAKFPEKPHLNSEGSYLLPVDINLDRADEYSQIHLMKNNDSMQKRYDKKVKDGQVVKQGKTEKKRLKNALITYANLGEKAKEVANKIHSTIMAETANEEAGVLWAVAVKKSVIQNQNKNICYSSKAFGDYSIYMKSHSVFMHALRRCKDNKPLEHAPVFQLIWNGVLDCVERKEAEIYCCDPEKLENYKTKAINILNEHLLNN